MVRMSRKEVLFVIAYALVLIVVGMDDLVACSLMFFGFVMLWALMLW